MIVYFLQYLLIRPHSYSTKLLGMKRFSFSKDQILVYSQLFIYFSSKHCYALKEGLIETKLSYDLQLRTFVEVHRFALSDYHHSSRVYRAMALLIISGNSLLRWPQVDSNPICHALMRYHDMRRWIQHNRMFYKVFIQSRRVHMQRRFIGQMFHSCLLWSEAQERTINISKTHL